MRSRFPQLPELVMHTRVLRVRDGLQVLGRVVRLVAVEVVDILVGTQSPSVGLLPYNAMLERIPASVRQVVAGDPNKDIAATVRGSASLPAECPLSPRVVPVDVPQRHPCEQTLTGMGLLRNGRSFATSAFAKAIGRLVVRRRAMLAGLSRLSVALRSRLMARNEGGRFVPVVLLPRDKATAAARAMPVVHKRNLITDDYWRVVSTNPATRNFAVSIGIA